MNELIDKCVRLVGLAAGEANDERDFIALLKEIVNSLSDFVDARAQSEFRDPTHLYKLDRPIGETIVVHDKMEEVILSGAVDAYLARGLSLKDALNRADSVIEARRRRNLWIRNRLEKVRSLETT